MQTGVCFIENDNASVQIDWLLDYLPLHKYIVIKTFLKAHAKISLMLYILVVHHISKYKVDMVS